MTKRMTALIGSLLIILALASIAQAQGPAPQHSAANWQATYWNNQSLSGAPSLQREEANIDYDWGTGSPGPGVNGDEFSARWTRYIDFAPGTYRFAATSDDGMRVWVDGSLIIDDWSNHAARTVTADRTIEAGHRLVTVEYHENFGQAVARLSWSSQTAISSWRGEYFNNTSSSGSPVLVRDDQQVNFDWGYGSPAPGIVNADNFSARWTRRVNLQAGNYTFTATVDDGARLWVNGHLLIDAWQVQALRSFSGQIYLPGGEVDLKMEYFEASGLATARLAWALAGGSSAPPLPPSGSVVVDDKDPGFVVGGASGSWRVVSEGFSGRLRWTKNNQEVRPNYNWARWYPHLAPGRYEVYVYIPYRYTTTAAARYWVAHRDGYTLRIVNQSAAGDQWVSLGTYQFQGTSADYVSLSDVTYEPYLSRLIGFDAVRWDPR